MPSIKTKPVAKDIKSINKNAEIAKRMKSTLVATKQKFEQPIEQSHDDPHNYATNTVNEKGKTLITDSVYKSERFGRKSVKELPSNIRKAKESIRSIKQKISKTEKGVKKATKSSVKTVNKGIKSTKSAVKTTERAAKGAVKAVKESAKAAKRAQQAAKMAVQAAKVTVKAVIQTIKAAITAIKGLVSLIAAGGWIAVVIILIICMVGLLVGSVFGIFASNDSNNGSPTMSSVVSKINADYQKKIDDIKTANTYDVLEISGSRAVWKDVLAVYSVKTVNDTTNPQEVATMDDSKKAILKSIFWEMNAVTSKTVTKTDTIIETTSDGNGNIVETEKTETRKHLYITVMHKTASEMADKYSWGADQRKQLTELLEPKNDGMWSAVLGGITSGSGDIVTIALSQLGNTGGQPYWSWYGFDSRVEWCACFVSWCANQSGYIDNGIIPKFATCQSQGVAWFKEHGQWQDKTYVPKTGDIIFFDWEPDDTSDHVGIVEKVENGTVYTIEGNSGDACKKRSYSIGSKFIYGYGVLQF